MKSTAICLPLFAALILQVTPAHAELDGDAIIVRANHAVYYQGKDARGSVKMVITDKKNRTRIREFTIMRRDDPGDKDGDQQFYVHFHEPSDVAKTVFMVHKKVGTDDDRWLYLPAIDLVKRISPTNKRTSFIGSDMFYEDLSGRGLHKDNHVLVATTKDYYQLKHTPKDPDDVEFSYYTSYIHRETFIPIKIEYYNRRGEKYRVITNKKVETIQEHLTVTKILVEDLDSGSKTTVELTKVRYDLDLPKSIFTERYLRSAPVKYMH